MKYFYLSIFILNSVEQILIKYLFTKKIEIAHIYHVTLNKKEINYNTKANNEILED